MRWRHYRLLLVPAVAAGLAILTAGCESEEIRAARLDAEAKWAAALEARAAIPTEERLENARHAMALADKKNRAAWFATVETVGVFGLANNPEYVATQEALRLAQQELRAAQRERDEAIELAEQLTVAAEEATAFLEAGKRAQR